MQPCCDSGLEGKAQGGTHDTHGGGPAPPTLSPSRTRSPQVLPHRQRGSWGTGT